MEVSEDRQGHRTWWKARLGPNFGEHGSDQNCGDEPHEEKYDVSLEIYFHG